MCLETLKGVKEIGGFGVQIYENKLLTSAFPEENGIFPIIVNHDTNTIAFKIQDGPIKEHGVNGCQVDTIIEGAKAIVEGLNKKFSCRENAMIITKLDEALMWSNKRKTDRENRGVEGTSKA